MTPNLNGDAVKTETTGKLAVGDKVRFAKEPRRPYLVRATSENFTVLTRQADFKPKGDIRYTVIDWRQQIRGPINVVGQGWDVSTDENCAELCQLLEAGEWEISHRNRLTLDIVEVAA